MKRSKRKWKWIYIASMSLLWFALFGFGFPAWEGQGIKPLWLIVAAAMSLIMAFGTWHLGQYLMKRAPTKQSDKQVRPVSP